MPDAQPSTSIFSISRGTGQPLVVLHGLPLDHNATELTFEPVFESRPGWRRIYLDLPGHGDSSAPETIQSNDDLAQVVGDYIESILPIERFALAGQSYGAYISRALAARFSGRMLGVMLWVPARYPREQRRPTPRTVLAEDAKIMSELKTDEGKSFGRLLVVQDRHGLDVIERLILPAARKSNDPFLSRVSGTKFSIEPEVAPFPHPALLLCGRQDMLVGYLDQLELLDHYPRATVAILDRAGHFLGLSEETELFRSLVSDWLDRMEAEEPVNSTVPPPARIP